jgi:hypothetical protein
MKITKQKNIPKWLIHLLNKDILKQKHVIDEMNRFRSKLKEPMAKVPFSRKVGSNTPKTLFTKEELYVLKLVQKTLISRHILELEKASKL